jgi:hypothetical protein
VRRLIVILAISTLGFAGVTLLGAPAGARVPAASGLCNALTNLHYTPSSDPTAAGGRSNAKKLAKAFTNAAKKAKGDIKAALKTLAQYFKDVANLNTANLNTAALQNEAQAFASATTRFASYLASNCVPGLPNGVTIPTIPSH